MVGLLRNCSSCANFSMHHGGEGVCRVWGAVITAPRVQGKQCPHWWVERGQAAHQQSPLSLS
ncbi:MAG: hypothetical protein NTZ53_00720 [Cyanobacteria bacterium]|nr:hypothetical protein [Cyanobacteriota bacterium]